MKTKLFIPFLIILLNLFSCSIKVEQLVSNKKSNQTQSSFSKGSWSSIDYAQQPSSTTTIDSSDFDFGVIEYSYITSTPFCVNITYVLNGNVVEPINYRLKVSGLPHGISSSVDSTGQAFRVCFQPSQFICDCMMPVGRIEGVFEVISKNSTIPPTIKPWYFEIKNDVSWFRKCKNCIYLFLFLLLLSIYLYGVWTKPRFNQTAKFEIHEVDRTSTYAPDNKKPRKHLPTGFISRYLVPYKPEIIIVDGMKIISTPTKSTILIAKESLTEKMSKNGEPVNPKSKKDLRVFRNNTIEIEKTPTVTIVYVFKVK